MGQKSIWNIEFGVKFDKHFSEHYLSMVFIDFDIDLIDYPKSVPRKIGKFPGKPKIFSEISRKIRNFLGNIPEFSQKCFGTFWNYWNLRTKIGI